MSKWTIRLLAVGTSLACYVGLLIFRILRKRDEKPRIAYHVEKQTSDEHAVLFFKANNNDCDEHIPGMKLCFAMSCPYRKLQYMVDTVSSAKRTIDICIHLFTSVELASALIKCHALGVKIRVIFNRNSDTNHGSQIKNLCRTGIPVKTPNINYLVHSKMAIIDDRKVMAGSANWTRQGMCDNWDNLVVTTDEKIVRESAEAFQLLWTHPYVEMWQPTSIK